MLVLNEADMRRSVTLEQVMDTVESAFRIFAAGKFLMPDRPSVTRGGDTILYMPCFANNCFGTKVLTLFPNNPTRGLPYINGIMMLNDDQTGEVVSLMDGRFLTALRTGAVGGVGVRCFAPAESRSFGLIGAGKQGFYQILYAAAARKLDNVYLYDSMPKDYDTYIASLRSELGEEGPEIEVCETVEELLEKSQIVVTTTTSTVPVVPNDPSQLRGKCFIAIGSYKPEMRELPDAIWDLVDQAYIELPYACEESGDLAQPLRDGVIDMHRVRYIGDLLTAHARPLPPQPGTTTYFKSVGIGLVDLCAAKLVYDEACKKGWGQNVDL